MSIPHNNLLVFDVRSAGNHFGMSIARNTIPKVIKKVSVWNEINESNLSVKCNFAQNYVL